MPETWHDCNGKIGRHLRYVPKGITGKAGRGGSSSDIDSKQVWALTIIVNYQGEYLLVKFCPICGEKLENFDV